jgi:hypothetical protein
MLKQYKIIGEYHDLSSPNGIVQLDFMLEHTGGNTYRGKLFGNSASEDVEVVGFISEITDPLLKKKYGKKTLQFLEQKIQTSIVEYDDDDEAPKKEGSILWQAYRDADGKFLGERIESLETITFSSNYQQFNSHFSKAAALGISNIIKFKLLDVQYSGN